ncbi:MAG: DUF3883 domain-containing protein [Verrucomicrobiales bacterium]|nr:DUF3883 domain-containing protein [Verrucomicrobiales bacterium]
MVNYDLPWNPNRLEQRFGRIHRIGQTEVCHLWNLVASETREGEVYKLLLEKLNQAREALGGQVFDVLGKVTFDNRPLKELLLEAVRYGDLPEVRAKLFQVVEIALDRQHLRDLLEEKALAHDSMDASKVRQIREDMERAAARRLQPHFVESYFLAAFKHLGGTLREREPRRYEITHVPATIRQRDRQVGTGEVILARYERITFEKDLINVPNKPLAEFVCPGHPLLDATNDIILERYRDLLKRGAILVDEKDKTDAVRALVFLEHAVQDARTDRTGNRRVISRQMQFVEIDAADHFRHAGYAPYLDWRPLTPEEEQKIKEIQPQDWVTRDLEAKALSYASRDLVPQHMKEVQDRKLAHVAKTKGAVRERLTKEINYWDHRAQELKLMESAGKINARLNSGLAQRRADELASRLQNRLLELDKEAQLSPLPPFVVGGVLVVSAGIMAKCGDRLSETPPLYGHDQAVREKIEKMAMALVMDTERKMGFEPCDVSKEKRGYDIESKASSLGTLRFIEVKGRAIGADTLTITRNEIMTALNKPEDFILAIVTVNGEDAEARYVRNPFKREPDFAVTSVNYLLDELLSHSTIPS